MSRPLKPYAAYTDSGLPWLGQIPGHWTLRRAKQVFAPIDVRSDTGKEELLTVSSQRGVVPRKDSTVTMFQAASYVGHKLCWPGDLVINSLWAWAGGLGVSRHHGIVSAAYGVYRPRFEFSASSSYFDYLVRSVPFHWELQTRSKGVWLSRLQLTDTSFLDAPIPIPPEDERQQIARYLTSITKKANGIIRNKRRLIALLTEQKQAVIHRAVTRGLDPDVPLKPSGVEWLGEVPAHWDVRRFKFVATINQGQVDPQDDQYREHILIAPNHIEGVTGTLLKQESAREQEADSGKCLVRKGQVIYSKIRPNLRKATIAPIDCLCSADMYAISPQPSLICPRYMLLLLLSVPFTKYAIDASMRVAMPKINREALGDCWLWFPPVQEQDQILDQLTVTLTPIEMALNRAKREIDLIREYRTRLIADVVTGKVDVRHLAADLPPIEADDPLPFDDLADLLDDADDPDNLGSAPAEEDGDAAD